MATRWMPLTLLALLALAGTPQVAVASFSFVETPTILPNVRTSMPMGDYDADGDMDVASPGTGTIYRNDGGVLVAAASVAPVFSFPSAWGDYDGDGDLDIAISGSNTPGDLIRVYRNDAGSFVDIGATFPLTEGALVYWIDYDNDGDLDLFAARREDPSTIFRNENGTFVDATLGLPSVRFPTAAFIDYDNDGDHDLFLMGTSDDLGGRFADIYRNDEGSFSPLSTGILGGTDGTIAWADVDADADLDFIYAGETTTTFGGVHINVNGDFSQTQSAPGLSFGRSHAGDMDNDGDADFLMTGWVGGNDLTVIAENDAGTWTTIFPDMEGVEQGSAELADFDNDGDLDALISGRGLFQNFTRLYLSQAATPNTPPTVPGNFSVSLSNNVLTMQWDMATDAETADVSLTYNLRVGTSTGANDVMPSMSTPAGRRMVPAMGNAGCRTSWSLDVSAHAGETLYCTVQALDHGYATSAFAPEQSTTVPTAAPTPSIPMFSVEAPYPNPFNPTTNIVFELARDVDVTILVFDLRGRKVRTLLSGARNAGRHSLSWDGRNDLHRRVASGVYQVRVETPWGSQQRSVALVE